MAAKTVLPAHCNKALSTYAATPQFISALFTPRETGVVRARSWPARRRATISTRGPGARRNGKRRNAWSSHESAQSGTRCPSSSRRNRASNERIQIEFREHHAALIRASEKDRRRSPAPANRQAALVLNRQFQRCRPQQRRNNGIRVSKDPAFPQVRNPGR